mmetsp:Transcript_19926/g.70493  ORF Transcript_19926/g.70493 Transcript_19926/m.70493 type:complete len:365 (+) Transcript_19926:814-1908(+)
MPASRSETSPASARRAARDEDATGRPLPSSSDDDSMALGTDDEPPDELCERVDPGPSPPAARTRCTLASLAAARSSRGDGSLERAGVLTADAGSPNTADSSTRSIMYFVKGLASTAVKPSSSYCRRFSMVELAVTAMMGMVTPRAERRWRHVSRPDMRIMLTSSKMACSVERRGVRSCDGDEAALLSLAVAPPSPSPASGPGLEPVSSALTSTTASPLPAAPAAPAAPRPSSSPSPSGSSVALTTSIAAPTTLGWCLRRCGSTSSPSVRSSHVVPSDCSMRDAMRRLMLSSSTYTRRKPVTALPPASVPVAGPAPGVTRSASVSGGDTTDDASDTSDKCMSSTGLSGRMSQNTVPCRSPPVYRR